MSEEAGKRESEEAREQGNGLPDEQFGVDREVELRAMANMLRRAEGFTIAFVQCNQPAQRRELVSELRQLLGDYPIGEVEFAGPIEHLLDELIPRLPEYENDRALFIYGLEHSIRSDRKFSSVVANLNVSRNLFPRHISCPIVLWLPAFAITAIIRGAPDFFSWRSAIFQFPALPGEVSQLSQSTLSGDVLGVVNLTLAEKEDRMAAIENLLAEHQSLPADKRDRRTEGRLVHRLGILHESLGNYAKSEDYCRQSLEIAEELGDKSGVASSFHQLGNTAYFRGDHGQAEECYQQSLEIKEELGDKSGIANSLHNLGLIAQDRGDYGQAEDYYRQSLEIKEELGNKSGIASSLHQLGIIAQDRGDHGQAEDYYRQSLEIAEELGNKSGIASSLHQLGKLYYLREDVDTAIRLLAVTRDIFVKIGFHYADMAEQNLTLIQEEVEEGRFEALVKEAQADPERVVREALSQ